MAGRQRDQPMTALSTFRYTALLLAGALLLPLRLPSAETLANLRSDVRTPPAGDSDSPRERDRDDDDSSIWDDEDHCESCADDSDGDAALLGLIGLGVTSPFWAPAMAVGDDYAQPGYFAHYPYEYDVGYMLIDPVEAVGLEGPRVPYSWAVRARGEAGTGFDDLDWLGGRVQVDTRWRLGLESDFRYVHQDLDAGRDSLWMGDANVLFRFAQSECVQFRTGLGFNWLSDRVDDNFGFNFTYLADWQPVRPLVFSAELDLGTLGHASVVHVRTTAGVSWGVTEAFVGYDLYDVGSTQIQGLVAGVQLWY
jgi:hypothetical protein